jgi:two-component system chemotaxis sensor kinase CheA
MDSLPKRYPPAIEWRDVACGVIAAPIFFPDSTVVTVRNWLLWFRPEVARTVSWGGDPNKPADHGGNGDSERRLHPRKSFDQWKENVYLESVPFEVAEVAAAKSLAKALTEVILEIEASRQIKENSLLVEASNRRLLAQIAENDRVQLVLEARTEDLRQRETSLQLVLDSTGEGLISVGIDGRLLAERSRAVEQWFGDLSRHEFIWDVLFEDAQRSLEFRCAWEELAADVLPFDLSADQICRELIRDGRSFELGFKEVRSGLALSSILVTIEDVTERAEARLAAREAGEAQTILASVLSDARGFGRALAELVSLSMAARDSPAPADSRRALHTLKGNAGLLGLMKLRERCHQVEDGLAERGTSALLSATDLSGVDEELARVRGRVRDLVGDTAFQRIEIPIGELTDAIQVIERGGEPAEVLARLRRWTLEPVARQLSKLASRARGLARDLGKNVDVVVTDDNVRVDAERFEPLWGALTHAVSNAIDHGIESEAIRMERGKASSGNLVLSVRDAGPGWVAIDIADDGGGIDLESVREAALRLGLPCTSRQELLDALFADELSTKAEVTLTSGRGVGLAALRDTCALLGGSVDLDFQPGIGTTLHLRLPVRALQPAVLPSPEPRVPSV